ncbi:HAMP domain-containing sensor histidine kinase [uncultured Algibacter sp.]|uniref:sensor histidine kinase n=1 Tax=uncultured Algibacter sp. TaxID=298659 RepID=UPI00262E5DFC|nr:HAMP domain-containing sensor histidine kinase [uncultured Algibacter sp.]
MAYNKFKYALFYRVFILFLALTALAFSLFALDFNLNHPLRLISIGCFLVLAIFSFKNLFKFVFKRFSEIDDFFESIKYKDFSRWFNEDSGTPDIQKLHKNFNVVNRSIIQINKEKEEQHLYLKKILELIQTGIIAYNIKTGNVLWVNDAFKTILKIPSLKTTHFIEKRNPKLYNTIFTDSYTTEDSITLDVENEKVKLLISSSVFQIKDDTFKLIVLQNIDDTLNKNESEAWKKLLSVMTHEIMNSIAPISSLADTLQKNLQVAIENPEESHLELEDINSGIKTIKNRSEGLLKFAKTYRSLSKVTNLNLQRIRVSKLFNNIQLLMETSIKAKNIGIEFSISEPKLELDIDTHLIEQVLINLILNAVDACKNQDKPEIKVLASQNPNRDIIIKVYDNGSGIPEDILENIFVPFFTSKATGSGIGLSLCKQIMLLHKGRVIVKSIEGEGSVFSLVF